MNMEEKLRLSDLKMKEMRLKNEALIKRQQEIEADKKNADEFSRMAALKMKENKSTEDDGKKSPNESCDSKKAPIDPKPRQPKTLKSPNAIIANSDEKNGVIPAKQKTLIRSMIEPPPPENSQSFLYDAERFASDGANDENDSQTAECWKKLNSHKRELTTANNSMVDANLANGAVKSALSRNRNASGDVIAPPPMQYSNGAAICSLVKPVATGSGRGAQPSLPTGITPPPMGGIGRGKALPIDQVLKRKLEITMTGAERYRYQQWYHERKNVDDERIARQRNKEGVWRREWDQGKNDDPEKNFIDANNNDKSSDFKINGAIDASKTQKFLARQQPHASAETSRAGSRNVETIRAGSRNDAQPRHRVTPLEFMKKVTNGGNQETVAENKNSCQSFSDSKSVDLALKVPETQTALIDLSANSAPEHQIFDRESNDQLPDLQNGKDYTAQVCQLAEAFKNLDLKTNDRKMSMDQIERQMIEKMEANIKAAEAVLDMADDESF